MTDQTDLMNVATIVATGNDIYTYFGCWLDFNQQNDPQFENPLTSGADGPFTGTKISFQQVIRNNHQCLIAQLYQNPDPSIPWRYPRRQR